MKTILFFILLCLGSCQMDQVINPDASPVVDGCQWGRTETHETTVQFHPYAGCPTVLIVIKPNVTYPMRLELYNEIHWPRYIEQDQIIKITDGADTCSFFVPGLSLSEAADLCVLGGFVYDETWQWEGGHPVQFHFIGPYGPGPTVSPPDDCWAIGADTEHTIEVFADGDTCTFILPAVPQS